ncbi:MAG: methylmalonyl-CoA epimerase [Chloroflexi bacterium]|nr:methylmalonyl-CoA epimerase [Chloroflexota bacterium]
MDHPALDHIALAVADIDAVAALYEDLFGLKLTHREQIDSQQVEMAFLGEEGATRLELIRPTTDNSGVARFLEKRGEGMHHIAFAVEDIAQTLADLKARGVQLIDEEPRPGAAGHLVAFIHPKAAHGTLIELVQHR